MDVTLLDSQHLTSNHKKTGKSASGSPPLFLFPLTWPGFDYLVVAVSVENRKLRVRDWSPHQVPGCTRTPPTRGQFMSNHRLALQESSSYKRCQSSAVQPFPGVTLLWWVEVAVSSLRIGSSVSNTVMSNGERKESLLVDCKSHHAAEPTVNLEQMLPLFWFLAVS